MIVVLYKNVFLRFVLQPHFITNFFVSTEHTLQREGS